MGKDKRPGPWIDREESFQWALAPQDQPQEQHWIARTAEVRHKEIS